MSASGARICAEEAECERRAVVIMTTFNRRETTLRCLRTLDVAVATLVGHRVHVVLVDASSSDGTADAVRELFPDVEVLTASSNTFWAGGMRQAWDRAQDRYYDVLVWLNDDVVLDPHALETLHRAHERSSGAAVVVGAFRDPVSGAPSYGGTRRGPALRRLSMSPVEPGEELQSIDAANGNLVWVPRAIDHRLGGFPAGYTHGMADNAFALEARRHGIPVVLAPGTAGTCARNPTAGSWLDSRLSAARRIVLLKSPKGLPLADYWRFCVRYGGITGPLYALKPYATLYAMWALDRLRRRGSRR